MATKTGDSLPAEAYSETLASGRHVTVYEDGTVGLRQTPHTRVNEVFLTPQDQDALVRIVTGGLL